MEENLITFIVGIVVNEGDDLTRGSIDADAKLIPLVGVLYRQ